MNIVKTSEGTKLTLAVEGRLDTTTAPQLEAELKSSLDGWSICLRRACGFCWPPRRS